MSSPTQLRKRLARLEESCAPAFSPNFMEVVGLAFAKLTREEREILRSGPYADIKAQHPALWQRLNEALAASVPESRWKFFMYADDLLLM